MKQPVNFRLSKETLALLAQLAAERHLSKTEVIEEAVKTYARSGKKSKKEHPLHEFVGTYSQEDADALMAVYHSRRAASKPILKW